MKPIPSRRQFLRESALIGGAAVLGLPGIIDRSRKARRDSESVVSVAPPCGPLRGMVEDGLNVFRAIPYATPPIGDLRFRPAVPAKPWTEPRDAFNYGAAPIQGNAARMTVPVSEDCLFLNVWAPPTPGPHPVFVWIYGGSNSSGTGSDSLYRNPHFAHNGIVVVTLNYRLGVFGFVELGGVLGDDYAGSGNNAIRDQALALMWVRDNIAAFGGDPARVTVGGESAGAKDVCALLGLPAASGLFRSAIVESGSGQTVFTPDQAADVAERFLAGLGLTHADAHKLLTLSTDEVFAAQSHGLASFPHAFPFRPVVDGKILPHRPVDAVAAGSARNVALLIGTNHDESTLFLPEIPDAQPLKSTQLANADLKSVQAVEAAYDQTFASLSGADRRIQLVTAEEYWIPSIRVAEAHAKSGGATYMYRFDFTSLTGKYQAHAVHGSELGFVWNKDTAGAAPSSDPKQSLVRMMQSAWAAFIKEQKPAFETAPEWPQYDSEKRQTMIFGRTVTATVESDPAGAQRRLWDGVL